MNGFEALIAELLCDEGYWIRSSVKVALTKDDKRAIGRPSSPRWEIDLVAYHAPENRVMAVECKSYLDNPGVNLADIQGGRYASRYKLFTEPVVREVVLSRLASDLVSDGFCSPDPAVSLALAVGRLRSDPDTTRAHFDENGWVLLDPQWIHERLNAVSDGGYTDSIAAMVAKVLLRAPI